MEAGDTIRVRLASGPCFVRVVKVLGRSRVLVDLAGVAERLPVSRVLRADGGERQGSEDQREAAADDAEVRHGE